MTIENTDSDLKVHALHYVKELLVRVRLFFQELLEKSLNTQKQYEKRFGKSVLDVDKSTDYDKPYFDFYVFMFFTTISTSKKMIFFSERELKKALRDTLTRAAWLGPSNFLLVRSEHAHASYPGLFFRPPGFTPYMERKESRVQGLDYVGSNGRFMIFT